VRSNLKQGKVLIFSVPFGTGHYRAAEAICKAFTLNNPLIQSRIVDSFSYATPVLGRFITETYMEILKISPRLYRFLYDKAESNRAKAGATRVLHLLMATKLEELIQEEQPDVLVCTHPFPLGVVSKMRDRGKIQAPIVAVITDFSIHSFWLENNVDMFIVGADELKECLISQGVAAEKIRVTGIPIDPAFDNYNRQEDFALKMGLQSELPILLVMGGGLGLGPVEEAVNALVSLSYPVQLVVVTGKNAKLEKRLKLMEKQPGVTLKVFGHVDNVHEFMEIADLVVTKPGGLTSAEALAKGLPLVLIDPIPGHEERNLDFLTTIEVAVTLDNSSGIARLVENVLEIPDKMARMNETAKRVGKPTSAQAAARVLADLIG
jgi:processive 1,2-diacylglycerol beta-glucosyltransferase